jgi:GR25 family glycosyltransferase involved in LPS biosynthesis
MPEPISLAPLLDHVDNVVVVTLAAARERHDDVRQLLRAHSLPFEFHYGFDGRDKTVESLAAHGIYDRVGRATLGRVDLTAPEIGCAVSHREVAQKLLESRDKRVLVIEDDVTTLASGLAHFSETMREMPGGWNLAYLAYSPMNLTTPIGVRLKLVSYYPIAYFFGSERHDPYSIRRIYRRKLNSRWMRAGWFNGALAYAIDRKAAEEIVRLQSPVRFESDIALGHLVRFTKLDAICAAFPLFDQKPGIPSIIGARPSWS